MVAATRRCGRTGSAAANSRSARVDLLLDSDVPVGAGLSSSAAIECSVALALRDLFGLERDRRRTESSSPAAAENDFVGAPTGILDQSASMLCTAGCALFLDIKTGEREQVPLDLAAAGLDLLVVDTEHAAQLVAGGVRRPASPVRGGGRDAGGAVAARGARLSTQSTRSMACYRKRARGTSSPRTPGCSRSCDLLRSTHDPRSIGPMLTAGHASLRDDFEMSTVQLDTAVGAALAQGAYGARMVGGGFGGSAIALVDVDAHRRRRRRRHRAVRAPRASPRRARSSRCHRRALAA